MQSILWQKSLVSCILMHIFVHILNKRVENWQCNKFYLHSEREIKLLLVAAITTTATTTTTTTNPSIPYQCLNFKWTIIMVINSGDKTQKYMYADGSKYIIDIFK